MFWTRNPLMGRTAGSGGAAFSVAFHASAVANAATITVPASVVDDDFGVLVDIAHNTSSIPSAVTPTNWTNRHNASGSGGAGIEPTARAMIHSKVLTTGEANTALTGMNDSDEDKVMLVFRPSRAIVTATFSSFNSQITGSDPSLQTVSAAGQPSPLIVIAVAAIPPGGTAAFATASPAFGATVAVADSDLIVGYKIYNSSPQNHSIDIADLGTLNVLASFFVRFT